MNVGISLAQKIAETYFFSGFLWGVATGAVGTYLITNFRLEKAPAPATFRLPEPAYPLSCSDDSDKITIVPVPQPNLNQIDVTGTLIASGNASRNFPATTTDFVMGGITISSANSTTSISGTPEWHEKCETCGNLHSFVGMQNARCACVSISIGSPTGAGNVLFGEPNQAAETGENNLEFGNPLEGTFRSGSAPGETDDFPERHNIYVSGVFHDDR